MTVNGKTIDRLIFINEEEILMSYVKQNFSGGQVLTATNLNHMEEGIAAAGTVKSVNGVMPDENGKIEFGKLLKTTSSVDVEQDGTVISNPTRCFNIVDGSSFGIPLNTYNQFTAEELNNSSRQGFINTEFIRLVMLSDGSKRYYCTGVEQQNSSNVFKYYFGDELAPILADSDNNTFVLDPDWVAPSEPEKYVMFRSIKGEATVEAFGTEWLWGMADGSYSGNDLHMEHVIIDNNEGTVINYDKTGYEVTSLVYDSNSNPIQYIVKFYFGDNVCPVIVDLLKQEVALDPNWVAPKNVPTSNDVNKQLVTNSDGEMIWEDRLAYYAKEEKLLIPETTVEATSTWMLHSNFEAQTGDPCRVILDGQTYTGSYYNANNGRMAAIMMTEGEGFPVEQFYVEFTDYSLSGPQLGFSGTLTVYVTTTTVKPLETEFLGIPATQGSSVYSAKIGNLNRLTASGSSSVALNESTSTGVGSCSVNSGIASGPSSFAQGTGEATSMGSAAFGIGTIAKGYAQFVNGKNNIEDDNGTYVMIVGNGQAGYDENDEYYVNRSNAHTLDWDGNAWFAGGIELTSPNGTRYRFTVADDGTLSGSVVTE